MEKACSNFRLSAAFEFKLQDCWIGAYWKRIESSSVSCERVQVDVWVCLLPCLPLHVRLRWS